MTRHIRFDGIHNFRDFGGYSTTCGRGVRKGRLYRSAAHHKATPADLERMRDLGLDAIVDLREPRERNQDPSRRWPEFAARVIENDEGSDRPDWFIAIREKGEASKQWVRDYAFEFYREMPFSPRYINLFGRFLNEVAESQGAVLVHCAAGKDRTGTICALTHHIAGVHHDDIMADYLLTNDPDHIEQRVAYLGPVMARRLGYAMSDDAIRAAASVEPEYLEAALQAIRDRCGDLDAYLEAVLGVDAPLRERIRERILN